MSLNYKTQQLKYTMSKNDSYEFWQLQYMHPSVFKQLPQILTDSCHDPGDSWSFVQQKGVSVCISFWRYKKEKKKKTDWRPQHVMGTSI